MRKIRIDTDPLRFLLSDYTSESFSPTYVWFGRNAALGDVRGVSLSGQFELTNGVISGSISSMSIYLNDDEISLTFSIRGDPVFVEDLAALQKSGTIGVQLLLSGDDDINGYNKGYNGNDTLHAAEIFAFDGGAGFDTLVFDRRTSSLNLDLNRDGANFRSIEAYVGTTFADDMRGTSGADNLSGGVGNDLLVGRTGNDALDGGKGVDRLIGSTGADILTGGSGKDTFVFERITDSTRSRSDHITDFNRADDIIDLRAIDANTERAGNQTFTWIGAEKFHGVAGELRHARSGDRTVITGDIDGDKVSDFAIYLDKYMKLTSLDFIL